MVHDVKISLIPLGIVLFFCSTAHETGEPHTHHDDGTLHTEGDAHRMKREGKPYLFNQD